MWPSAPATPWPSPSSPVPQVHSGGSSPAAGEFAARRVGVSLTGGGPPPQVAGRAAWIRRPAVARGRTPRSGSRLRVLTDAGSRRSA
ncbi:LLM class flavin-dependent oxidoreductase [Streptomyces sp. SBST2-5]|uniref:LLM class flavin-dependent oxidoreductase n=1 Tax=Streptomyces composti TaxID=2720025 RepID=A0ABX1A7A1_9ACTN|nr:LLM class flavin-dependent oxidoreductase [Streptomyces composti]